MNDGVRGELSRRFGERLRMDEPLSRYTTYKIGGPAAALLLPQSAADVVDALELCGQAEVPWVVLGLGSNVLVADEGFPGLAIRLGKGVDGVLELREDDRVWRVAAGMPTPRLARQTAKAGLAGAHMMVGIPGTVGGGVAMNAGANGQEYAQIVQSVEVVTSDGALLELSGDDVRWQYRGGFAGGVVTAATLRFESADSEALSEDIRACLAVRKERTPYDHPCCGSVFKNPATSGLAGQALGSEEPPLSAGRLIDAAGCKGYRVGDAEVSKLHANYIVNLGHATAAEVLAVIESVRGRVFGEFGVELELEVRIFE